MGIQEMSEIEQLAYKYGKYVALREYAAERGTSRFDDYNDICGFLWNRLKDLGAYKDVEASEFKPEYREFYYSGMERHTGRNRR